ncbi:limonene 1,2-monooxygenase [Kitasatospora sp. MAP12-15]|uniref:LLM class flavin-dependent oxidoreductase n=1 Tax=unclassified Kitasatospora TaxID=2633591 RepID=UPI0024730508|nr:LLM class flavin-dependent oxidoreductase [Kitasatospora sp. MAP12-44]MDH6113665.1 limonene 1,2-monooxygenase [Kitasatospora sp. MAP12-44]
MSLKFGAFMAPFHSLNEDPTIALWRHLELIEWLDTLGIDEAWVGEHHSGGFSPVACPELLLAAAVERTRRIKLGTGVVSLPYHHPLTVAERLVQLDHQSRGRIIMGMGAGVSPADAYMMGIEAADQRRRMAESLDAVVKLLTTTEPVNAKTDWFELREARLQLRPYSEPLFDLAVAGAGSERGMRLAGKYGLGSLTFAGRPGMKDLPLAPLWQAAEDEAAQHGTTVDRSKWRVAVCLHLADTTEEAKDQVRPGMTHWFKECVRDTFGAPATLPVGREVDAAVEARTVIVGSVDDAIEAIERMLQESGGFGTLLVNTHDWATREQVKHSFELLARYVAPHFSGALTGIRASQRWMAANKEKFALEGGAAAQAAAAASAAPVQG